MAQMAQKTQATPTKDPFVPATIKGTKLRMLLSGAAKSGKTWTALMIATSIVNREGGKIAFIDTEGRSAAKYAPFFKFNVLDMSHTFDAIKYINAIKSAAQFGYTVIVVDSFSHAWNGLGGVLDVVDKTGAAMKGNTWAGWSKGRPLQNQLVGTIHEAQIHIIGTARAKTDWVLEVDPKTGKTNPVRVGLATVQSNEFEYEFDILGMMNAEHVLTVTGSRCHLVKDHSQHTDIIALSDSIMTWLNGDPVKTDTPFVRPPVDPFQTETSAADEDDTTWCEWCGQHPALPGVPCDSCRALGASEDDPFEDWLDSESTRIEVADLFKILEAETGQSTAKLAEVVKSGLRLNNFSDTKMSKDKFFKTVRAIVADVYPSNPDAGDTGVNTAPDIPNPVVCSLVTYTKLANGRGGAHLTFTAFPWHVPARDGIRAYGRSDQVRQQVGEAYYAAYLENITPNAEPVEVGEVEIEWEWAGKAPYAYRVFKTITVVSDQFPDAGEPENEASQGEIPY
ncbi:MAG: AAA family ATPase [Anaerolineae bacterium]|nr:AAA family ATPase [Anaerolineae bacterium]